AAAPVTGLFVARGLVTVDAEMFSTLTFYTRALDHVPEMRDHAHLGEELTVFVEVNAPGIAAAFSEHFEHVPGRMITPDASVHPLALSLGRARPTDVRRAEYSVATVEPAVGSPGERVPHLVGVLENEYPVCPAKNILELFPRWFAAIRAAGTVVGRRISAPTWIGKAFGGPDPSAIIDTESDRLLHVRFGSKDVQLEAGRQTR